ncbi:sugar transferase [Candidatus Saccharibacteria bacterium]|nr:sugar transferase [Candidatus Saccharibacteria bacterium]
MKKDSGSIYRLFLMLGDATAIVLSFAAAYFIRTHLDDRPYHFDPNIWEFTLTALLFVPLWWLILATLGLYRKRIILGRSRSAEFGRIFFAAIIGMMTIITYDFFFRTDLFPVRPVALWALVLCFISLVLFRAIIRRIRYLIIVKTKRATRRVIIIGNSKNTENLLNFISTSPEEGYRVVAIIANSKYIPEEYQHLKRNSLKETLEHTSADIIFQTDELKTENTYSEAVKNHMLYYFVPTDSTITSHIGSMELIGDTPAILVKVTPLMGGARIAKRATDIILGTIAFAIALIPMLIIWIIVKLSDPKNPALYSEYRLSRYNKRVKIYKFRSMSPEYSGMSPEKAFEKMGKPELIEQYRSNGDYLKNDPRITKIGRVLRKTSLDELPQLWNVIKGDISLVGPRALVPGELKDYGDRSLLLSVKSGLTGLAQVSGRRDISFEERRALDLYYIQNWSLLRDFQIMLRTIGTVLFRKGAK